jgi:hypothetical protein
LQKKQTKHIELEQEIKNKDYLDESFFLFYLKTQASFLSKKQYNAGQSVWAT